MSADNGIYILSTPNGLGYEYRVIHTQAIDNIMWIPTEEQHKNFDYSYGNPRNIVDYFQNSPRFETEDEALLYASSLYDEIMADDFPILEYGINKISLEKSFDWYVEKAKIQPKSRWD